MALAVPALQPHLSRTRRQHQVSSTPQGGFMLKVNGELVLTNVVARDAKTGELVQGLKQSDFTILRKRQAAADRHLRF